MKTKTSNGYETGFNDRIIYFFPFETKCLQLLADSLPAADY